MVVSSFTTNTPGSGDQIDIIWPMHETPDHKIGHLDMTRSSSILKGICTKKGDPKGTACKKNPCYGGFVHKPYGTQFSP